MDERTKAVISAVVVIIANLGALWGVTIDQAVWVNGLCAVVTLLASAWGIWKNHNFTSAAIEGQQLVNLRKLEAEAKAARGE